MFQTINPHTGEEVARYEEMQPKKVENIINDVHAAWGNFRLTSFSERGATLQKIAAILRARKRELATLMATEMGKPFQQGIAEAEKCAWVCEYYAENGEKFLADEIIPSDAKKSYVSYQPLGVVLAIMPWNFPFWQVFRFAAPAIMAGNCVLLKHAPNVTGCALEIEKIVNEAGLPGNAFRTIIADIPQVENIIRNKKIAAVTLTGSTGAGRSVAAIAGSEIKKCVLELGGSDPYIVSDTADIDLAVKACITGRFLNGGQSCIAAKRLLIFSGIYDAFKTRFLDAAVALKSGDPMDENSFIGPMARADLREALHKQVVETIAKGAKLLTGGYIPEEVGFHYPVTVLEEPTLDSPACTEEVFGPVAILIKVNGLEDALRIANSTDYGLGAAVFTADTSFGEDIAKNKLETGSCFLNTFVKSDPRLPFGGIKTSGFGRELSLLGIREFVNAKTVYIA
ncbi:MAG: NAD-dependent succinate-semialdehyde dehydrogenase [Ignavibacteriales bacterium]|nr:MAG: NAD-dependent succinate-semialdehyde dehydrogenase [Ignavibacteriaceae bacterium]MBV6445608.1 Succinate semialdehyde dehydrogenase [NAD(P)+] Sad [Ignavibacteriaceae bacterium]MBW7872245.1 NAD-dependent succinate-semialdehyde dehydrogenase [Ignavibacteria bacterium]MCZ2144057.1 NAD-dependent succinate-semialdehyde dehydrogenase [Ignavibacteriales bacterium]WKZ73327.1 MAG: NAD-dependent succinate-semialdehyde dehydrogenase [Ignavibacteriaceae bacterium]